MFYDHASNNINAINFSLPQGSVLGPLLFIIYVKYFPNCLKNGTSLSFADDRNILISGNNAKSIFETGNQELHNVDNWLPYFTDHKAHLKSFFSRKLIVRLVSRCA